MKIFAVTSPCTPWASQQGNPLMEVKVHRRLAFRLLLAVASMSLAIPAAGDSVRTRNGSEIEGIAKIDPLRLTGVEGDLEVPRSSIRELRTTANGLEVVLTDGSVVVGVPAEANLKLEVGLVVRSIPFAEIESVSFEPAAPKGVVLEALAAGEFARVNLVAPGIGPIESACPMRLQLDLPRQPPATVWRTGALRQFVCDGVVSIPQLALEARGSKRGSAQMRLDFFVLVLPHQDKLSHLIVEVLFDGQSVAKGGRAQVSTEEGRTTSVRVDLELSPAEFDRWKAGVSDPVLRVTVAAVDE